MKSTKNQKNDFTVAIIGAGPGGLYTAMRLLESGHDPNKITIFEATQEVGGRVRTLPIKDCPFTGDIGAMRYIENRQLIINSLVDEFGLKNENHDVPLFGHYLRGTTILPYVVRDEGIKMFKPEDNQEKKNETTERNAKPIHDTSNSGYYTNDSNKEHTELPNQDAFKLTDIEQSLSPQQLIGYAILKAFSKLQIDSEKCVDKYEAIAFDVVVILQKLHREITVVDNKTRERVFDSEQIKKKLKTFSFDSFTLDQWHVIRNAARYVDKEYGMEYLYETCLFNILQRELSSEAVTLSQDALGYSSVFGAANAADLIPWFLNEFGNQTYKTIDYGMSELISSLVNRIESSMAARTEETPWLNLGHLLLSVKKDDDKYKLRFESNATLHTYDRIIFSVSKGALERINFDHRFNIDPMLQKFTGGGKLREVVQAVTAYPLLKAFLFFEKDWFWSQMEEHDKKHFKKQFRYYETHKDNEEKNGNLHRRINFSKDLNEYEFVSTRILTDLPIRQIYFHGPGGVWWRKDAPEECKNVIKGMIMAYGDSRQAEYWTSLAGRNSASDKKARFKMTKFISLFPKEEKKLIANHGVSNSLINMLMRNIREVLRGCGLKDVDGSETDPIAVFMQDWNEAPYYGGWHAWGVNYKPWEVRKYIQRPFVDQHIYISGEVFSPDQGWIEGALRISESILQSKHFNLKTPKWIERNLKMLFKTSWYNKNDPESTVENYLKW